MVESYQKEALATRLSIPLLYGVDAVHGHGNLQNATIFPHNIGLGAANDPLLMQRIGRATAEEILASGIPWNFAPVLAVVQDVRWGRTYESYSESTDIVTSLGRAYLEGMHLIEHDDPVAPGQLIHVLGTPKHFIGDGATVWGSSTTGTYQLDQGDAPISEDVLRKMYLPPYRAAVNTGAMSVMASFSSWQGTKVHAQKFLLTDLLKDELGFHGFVVSDWQAIDQIHPDDYYQSVVTAINAGIDMNMVPYDYLTFIETMKEAVASGDISEARVDDAVRRILRAKFAIGLFEQPMPDFEYRENVRSLEHLELAREAVRKSLVLLKNDNNALPLDQETPIIFIAGEGADDIGLQSGGWTLEWQGKPGNENEGTTILEGINDTSSPATRVEYAANGDFTGLLDSNGDPMLADVGIVVLAEQPYAEGVGDQADLSLTDAEVQLMDRVGEHSNTVIVILISGRPRVITEQLPLAQAWVAAWLPGTEGMGVADVLFGREPFTGKLPFTWPRTNDQLPININNAAGLSGCGAPLFPFGYGLAYGESSPEVPSCTP